MKRCVSTFVAVLLAAIAVATIGIAPAAASASCSATYTVQRGDTLSRIAARCGVTTSAVLLVNPTITNASRIYVGQRILIPWQGVPVASSVKIALIAPSGGTIGCGDAVQYVTRSVTPTQSPLTAALRSLLSVKEQHYGQSGLYNALYQSDLQVASVQLSAGKVTIRLTGHLVLGGVCDSPRAKAQIERTALQFSTVKSVAVYVNGVALDTLLSGK